MPRGGKREGAGRKKKNPDPAKASDRARVEESRRKASQAQQIIDPWLPGLLENAKKLADGVYIRDAKTGEVYLEPPSIKAITYLVDRLCGKPTERNEDNLKQAEVEEFFAAYQAVIDEAIDRFCTPAAADQIRDAINKWAAAARLAGSSDDNS